MEQKYRALAHLERARAAIHEAKACLADALATWPPAKSMPRAASRMLDLSQADEAFDAALRALEPVEITAEGRAEMEASFVSQGYTTSKSPLWE